MSGSMSNIIAKAREGFNSFLKEQQQSKNKIKFSLLFFDSKFYMPYDNVNIKKVLPVNENTYYANGSTSLYDAIGFSIDNYVDKLASDSKRPDKTLFVILTDGEENSSKVFNLDKIRLMINEMREDFNCEFIYLGANQDSKFQADKMGMDKSNAFDYDATNDGITIAYSNISKATSYYVENDVKENLFQL